MISLRACRRRVSLWETADRTQKKMMDWSILFPYTIDLTAAVASFLSPVSFIFVLIAGVQLTPDLLKSVRRALGIDVVSVKGVAPNAGEHRGRTLIYIARRFAGWLGSPLGNPYRIGVDGDRAQVIQKYREWLRAEYRRGDASPATREIKRIAGIVEQGNAVALGCWCKPADCHGDAVADAVAFTVVKDMDPEEFERQFGSAEQ